MLKLSKEPKEQEFDEVMNKDGKWVYQTNCKVYPTIKKLDYKSDYFDYFVAEDKYGEHFLLRIKKGDQ